MPNKKENEKVGDGAQPSLKVNPQVEAALKNTKEKLGFVGDKPLIPEDYYCWKHGNIGSATFLMVVNGEILSNHCLHCLSNLLKVTVGSVVSSQDFLKTQMLVSALAQQPESMAESPPELEPEPKKE